MKEQLIRSGNALYAAKQIGLIVRNEVTPIHNERKIIFKETINNIAKLSVLFDDQSILQAADTLIEKIKQQL